VVPRSRTEGKRGGQADVKVWQNWKEFDRLRALHGIQPHRPVRTRPPSPPAMAKRRLSKKITVDVRGEILELKKPHTMVDQLNSFTAK